MSVQFPLVMPAKAGIQAFFLDSRPKHAGMTSVGNGHCGALLSAPALTILSIAEAVYKSEEAGS
jgi:hypothetical protein